MEVPKVKAKGKASAARKKILEELGEKSIEEMMAEQRGVRHKSQAIIDEAGAMQRAQAALVTEAQSEYDKARSAVEAAIDQECTAANNFKAAKAERDGSLGKAFEARNRLVEAQKKVAMMEVLEVNQRKMKELEEKRKAATDAAEAAKRGLQEQRQREKDALEATKKALEVARTKAREAKGLKPTGVKRAAVAAQEPEAKRAAPEADTVPATLPDGEDIE